LPILVVCSCADGRRMLADLPGPCDALLWKAMPGYDFSACTLALRHLRHLSHPSPGADVIVMNDSVFGPFTPLRPVLEISRWDLTGFTASNELTNHVQSYAFCLRGVTLARMARVAARAMMVGALWVSDATRVLNPTLVNR